jgi:hypothetical protein
MKSAGVVALLLVVIGTARIVSTWTVFNHTIDEPDTLAAGMEYLSTGRYLYEDQQPPLARLAAAVGPFLAGERFHPGPDSYSEGYRILGHDAHYDRILALSRAGNLIFFWIASGVVFLWARRIAGPGAAVIATLLFTTLPPILAHAGLATTDMSLCAMLGAAALTSQYWVEAPTRGRSIALGALTALALCAKFSAVLYLPAAWLLMCVAARQHPRALLQEAWARRRSIAIAAGICALAVWAIYGFTFGRVDFLHLRLPAPRFFSGIHSVWTHSQRGHASYLLGKRSASGFWYYFPTVLALKTPLGLLGLLAVSPWLVKRPVGPAAALALGIVVPAMFGNIDIGVRHVLPVYVALAVICGCAAVGTHGRLAQIAVVVLIGWHVISGDLAHPDYLAYTNEITHGHPEDFLADSDLDWGQDMKRLGEFLADHHATEVTFAPFNRTYPLAGHAMVPIVTGETQNPSKKWNAVSVTIWKVFGYPAWADRAKQQYRIGKSIFLYYF